MWRIASPSELVPPVEPSLQARGDEASINSLVRPVPVSAAEFAATQWALAFLDMVRDGAI